MLYPSTQTEDRRILFQVFCGRWEVANVVDHRGEVLRRLSDFGWMALKRSLGLTHIYLLGLWDNRGHIIVDEEGGENIRQTPNRCPSPFAVTDHNRINPLLGTSEDFLHTVQSIQKTGMQVIVDFIPNHTGLAHQWSVEHPEYYKRNQDGLPKTAFSGDVAVLDYDNPQLCDEMVNTLYGIASLGVNGVRCDMAHLIPSHFWRHAIDVIKEKYPEFTFIAEAYSDSVFDLSVQTGLMTAGFDAVYDEPLFRNIKAVATGALPDYAAKHAQYELTLTNSYRWVHYVSNHDDEFPMPVSAFMAWQGFVSLLPGWHLLYNGSIWGYEGRLAHHSVQILPERFYLPEHLPGQVRNWFKWLIEENPELTGIEIQESTTICATWKSRTKTGHCWLNMANTELPLELPSDEMVILSSSNTTIFPVEPYGYRVTECR